MRAKEKLILEEAIRCIRERGLKETNSNAIAARLKMRPSNVFYYFPKQQDLYDRLIQYCVSFNQEITSKFIDKASGRGSKEQMFAYLKGNLSWATKHPEQVAIFLSGAGAPDPENSLRRVASSALAEGESKVSSILAHGVAKEELILRYSLESCSQIIHHALMGAIVMISVSRVKNEKFSFDKLKLCFEALTTK